MISAYVPTAYCAPNEEPEKAQEELQKRNHTRGYRSAYALKGHPETREREGERGSEREITRHTKLYFSFTSSAGLVPLEYQERN